jgi:hypothetical protein
MHVMVQQVVACYVSVVTRAVAGEQHVRHAMFLRARVSIHDGTESTGDRLVEGQTARLVFDAIPWQASKSKC